MGRKKHKTPKNLGFIGKTALLINIGAVLLLLVSYFAPTTDPQKYWPIAFIGMAYLPLLFLNVVFVLIWLFRKRSYMLLSLAAILIGWDSLQAHIGFRSGGNTEKPLAADSNAVRTLTYNVHLFRDFKQKKNEPDIQEEAIALIAEVAPDVVCVQEFYSRNKGKHDITQAFRNELGLIYHYFHPVAQNDFESYGLAIFSKYPIRSSGHLPDFERGVNSIIYSDIEVQGQLIRIYNVHLRSFGFKQEDYDFIAGATERSMETNVSSTKRIGGRIKQAFEVRSMQSQSLRKHIENNSGPYLILGDFNDTPLSYAVNHVGKGLKNAFKEKGAGWGKTYNGDFPNFQIDYILASPGFRVGQYHIIPRKLSDHYPVWADLYLQ